jgi:hypothetical protein
MHVTPGRGLSNINKVFYTPTQKLNTYTGEITAVNQRLIEHSIKSYQKKSRSGTPVAMIESKAKKSLGRIHSKDGVGELSKSVMFIDPALSRIFRLKRRIHSWAEALKNKEYVLKMITLTYAPDHFWRAGDIRRFMLDVKDYLGDNLAAYAWVAEIQQGRGIKTGEAVEHLMHYHVLLALKEKTYLPGGERFWAYGTTRITNAKSPFYLVSYAKKSTQKGLDGGLEYPKGARVFAVWLSSDVEDDLRAVFKSSALPAWVRDLLAAVSLENMPKRSPIGGGYDYNGEHYESPYRLAGMFYKDD